MLFVQISGDLYIYYHFLNVKLIYVPQPFLSLCFSSQLLYIFIFYGPYF